MGVIEDVRKVAEKATVAAAPSGVKSRSLYRGGFEPRLFRFDDDGVVPNHPTWPLIIYRNAAKLPATLDPAAVFEDLFEKNR